MFKKLLFVSLILVFSLSACTINGLPDFVNQKNINGSGSIVTEDRDVSGFTSVDLKSIGNLTITQGSTESLTITADENLMRYITTKVVNGTLEIGMEPNVSLNPSRTIEYNLVMKSVEGIQLSGFGNIDADELTGKDLEVRLAGSGDINIGNIASDSLLVRISGFGDFNSSAIETPNAAIEIAGSGDINVEEIQAEDLEVKISGFGDASLSGKVTGQDVQILGSGDYDGADLECQAAVVKITGFGNATVWATDTLDINITGSGDVGYYGSPRVTQSMTGFGKVNSLGEHE